VGREYQPLIQFRGRGWFGMLAEYPGFGFRGRIGFRYFDGQDFGVQNFDAQKAVDFPNSAVFRKIYDPKFADPSSLDQNYSVDSDYLCRHSDPNGQNSHFFRQYFYFSQ
jgi:hypothetical protein